MLKRNEGKLIMKKKIMLKGNITATYTEHKHKNTGISVLIHLRNV